MTRTSLNVTIDDLVIDDAALYETIRKSFTRDPFDHYVNGICGLCICLLGVISNALSFSILIRRTMCLSSYVYLAGLCLSDFTTCLFLIPGHILDAYPIEIPDFELPRTYAYTKLLIIAGAVSTTTRVLSVWLCVAFTIDRWIMICRPFVGPIYCTVKNARYVTLIIYILGVFYALPLMFEHETIALNEIFFANNHKRIYRYVLSNFGKNSIFRWAYVILNALGVYVIPLTTIVILNRKLFVSIRSLERRSAEYNVPLPTKQGVTVMLLATTVLLLVFRIPSAIISVMWLISAKMFINDKPPFHIRKFHMIANLCATLNAATTFIMFMIYGTKFRSEFTDVYCYCFNKLKTTEGTIENHQEQHIKQLLPDDPETHLHNPTNRISTNPNGRQASARHSSVATTSTTTTSIASLPSFKRLRSYRRNPRYSLERERDLIHHNSNTPQHHELAILEGEHNNNIHNKDTKLDRLSVTYSDCFVSLITCR